MRISFCDPCRHAFDHATAIDLFLDANHQVSTRESKVRLEDYVGTAKYNLQTTRLQKHDSNTKEI